MIIRHVENIGPAVAGAAGPVLPSVLLWKHGRRESEDCLTSSTFVKKEIVTTTQKLLHDTIIHVCYRYQVVFFTCFHHVVVVW